MAYLNRDETLPMRLSETQPMDYSPRDASRHFASTERPRQHRECDMYSRRYMHAEEYSHFPSDFMHPGTNGNLDYRASHLSTGASFSTYGRGEVSMGSGVAYNDFNFEQNSSKNDAFAPRQALRRRDRIQHQGQMRGHAVAPYPPIRNDYGYQMDRYARDTYIMEDQARRRPPSAYDGRRYDQRNFDVDCHREDEPYFHSASRLSRDFEKYEGSSDHHGSTGNRAYREHRYDQDGPYGYRRFEYDEGFVLYQSCRFVSPHLIQRFWL
ncbi:hypothetical protein SCHPADRAFT_131820 [Schizopora paradoxa]|uniref:Uncharacterized protein n=1 Tax=Schizopora paradoxa TaxID=27342 RepID=A0A0H2S2A0_9AGAM|nr:hypothetical protein SCHPADRAFT_131820 [Schizopora paradoxa]